MPADDFRSYRRRGPEEESQVSALSQDLTQDLTQEHTDASSEEESDSFEGGNRHLGKKRCCCACFVFCCMLLISVIAGFGISCLSWPHTVEKKVKETMKNGDRPGPHAVVLWGDANLDFWDKPYLGFFQWNYLKAAIPNVVNLAVADAGLQDLLPLTQEMVTHYNPSTVVLHGGAPDIVMGPRCSVDQSRSAGDAFTLLKQIVETILAFSAETRIFYFGMLPEPESKDDWSKRLEYDKMVKDL